MILTRIGEDCRPRFLSKRGFDLSLSSPGNKLIFLGQMHQKWRTESIGLSEILFGVAAVIRHSGIEPVVPHGCNKDHQRAEAIAEGCHLAIALREVAYCVDGVLHVPRACISVISSVET